MDQLLRERGGGGRGEEIVLPDKWVVPLSQY